MNKKIVFLLVLIAVVGVAGYAVMNAPDKRTDAEKLGDAVEEIGKGFENAADELNGDKTVGDKMVDTLKDAKEELKENVESATSDEGAEKAD